MGAKYIGTEPGVVRIGDRPIMPGEVVSAIDHPPEVVDSLLQRGDFIATDMIDELEHPPKKTTPKKAKE